MIRHKREEHDSSAYEYYVGLVFLAVVNQHVVLGESMLRLGTLLRILFFCVRAWKLVIIGMSGLLLKISEVSSLKAVKKTDTKYTVTNPYLPAL